MAPRTILYTGKGGVGKTSVAAATARRCAAAGRRTVVLSTDPAHSLADVLEAAVGGEPVQVGDPGVQAGQQHLGDRPAGGQPDQVEAERGGTDQRVGHGRPPSRRPPR
jgi:CO dehydrogenase nickel-insertion accessory protein CooC1